MSPIDRLFRQIRAYCRKHANPAQVERYSRYFKDGYDAWGIDGKDPMWSEQLDQWFEQIKELGLEGVIQFGEKQFAKGKYEEGSVAIHFLARYKDSLTGYYLTRVESWFAAGLKNWAHTDVLCDMVLGPALVAGNLKLEDFKEWRESVYTYQRRAVPVAMLGLLKTKATTKRLLQFIEPMMGDRETFPQKGIGWFLREAWKRDPAPVEKFLLEHKDEAPRTIMQYATEKMTKEQKAQYRAAKKERILRGVLPNPGEASTSPDGRTRVEYGYSQGRMSHDIYSPKITDVATGEVLLDLTDDNQQWDSYVQWLPDGDCELGVRHYWEGGRVNLHVRLFRNQGTFSIDDGPQEPIASIKKRICKAFYKKTMRLHPPEEGSWEEEWLEELGKA